MVKYPIFHCQTKKAGSFLTLPFLCIFQLVILSYRNGIILTLLGAIFTLQLKYNASEGVKKLISSTFVPKGRVDFQSFRMRSLRLEVTRHGNKDMCLSELMTQCFNFQRLRSKASPIHPSFPFEPCARFFTPPPLLKGE